MEIGRRPFMKGLAAVGVAASGVSISDLTTQTGAAAAGAVASDAVHPVSVLICGDPLGAAFLAGARAGALPNVPTVLQSDREGMVNLRRFFDLWDADHASRIVGMVDDANAAIIVESARAKGVRQFWLGHHCVSAAADIVRHNLLTTIAAHAHVALFADLLRKTGEPFQLIDRSLSAETGPTELLVDEVSEVNVHVTSDWAATLGALLVRPFEASMPSWHPPTSFPTMATAPLSAHQGRRVVSFVFETVVGARHG
jgi:hypothetical protein